MLKVRFAANNVARRVAQALPTVSRAVSARAPSSALLSAVSSAAVKSQPIGLQSSTPFRTMASGPAASATVVSDELLSKLGSLSTQVGVVHALL